MSKKYTYSVLGLTLLIASLLMMSFGNDPRSYTVAELKEILETRDDLLILDVRTEREFYGELGHIEGATLIPIQQLEARLAELDLYRDDEIIVICRTQNRSRSALSILEKAGFQKISFVRGGMMEWNKLPKIEE